MKRAASDFERWEKQVARTGYCAKPVRLSGSVAEVDRATGEISETFNSDSQPDGTLLIACNDRRESRCPSCAARYRGDAFQIVASGVRGGKGVPERVAEHPMLFVTFTAPSFGPVHRSSGAQVHPCRPRRSGKCPHGIPRACWKRHERDDPEVGRPLCGKCFDYEGQVLWNALAPELWRRTTIYIYRALARAAGMKLKELTRSVRVSYVKVAEYQRRGAVHFHAVIRLDGRCPHHDDVPPPPEEFTAEVFEEAVRSAVDRVAAPIPGTGDQESRWVARWGRELHVRAVGAGTALSSKAVGAYLAKYATKCSDDLGLGGIRGGGRDEHEESHLLVLVRAAEGLSERADLRALRLERHAFDLGFKGHFSTKSRRYSTTFTALRRARREFAARGRCVKRVPLDEDAGDEGDVERRGSWRYLGSGYRNKGEAYLAMLAATRAREYRRLAREELSIEAMRGGET